MRRYGQSREIVTDRLLSYGAALKELGAEALQSSGRWLNNHVQSSHLPLLLRERATLRIRSMQSLQIFAAVHTSDLGSSTRNAISTVGTISSTIELLISKNGGDSSSPESQGTPEKLRPVRFRLTAPPVPLGLALDL